MSLEQLILPQNYITKLTVKQTEAAIKLTKDTFENKLAANLNLSRVSAPLFVRPETGLNDNLNGIERPVSFDIKEIQAEVEVVQSLAKWKRLALKRYGFASGEGLYTDMNAIRRDEDLDNLHSVYVDQWDWEKVILASERNIDTLKTAAQGIMKSLKETEMVICQHFDSLVPYLPEELTFITSQELEDKYPELSSKEREDKAAQEFGAIFVTGIGGKLKSGKPHDSRAPDYDDWQLNGDLLIWYPVLNRSVELSSMGIRVDAVSLRTQLAAAGCQDRSELPFHRMLLNGQLPLTMGGGIGQSRLCLLLLQKAHIGEVQASVWSDCMIEHCAQAGIMLL